MQNFAEISKVAIELIDVPLCLRRSGLARGASTQTNDQFRKMTTEDTDSQRDLILPNGETARRD